MDTLLQIDEDALSAFQDNINPGKCSGLYFEFSGTNATGNTNDFDQLGTIVVKRNGETIINRKVSQIADKNNLLAGSNLLDSTADANYDAVTYLPFYIPTFEQALDIVDESELNVEYIPGDTSVFDNLRVKVYSEKSDNAEQYDYFFLGDDKSPNTSYDNRPLQLSGENITGIYITDSGDIVTKVGLRQNEKQKLSEQSKNMLLGRTLKDNRIEANTVDMVRIKTYTDKVATSVLNRSSVLVLSTSGGGTVEISKEYIRLKNQRIRSNR